MRVFQLFLICFTLLSLQLFQLPSYAAKGQSGIYRSSNERVYSSALGVMTYQAVVIVDNARYNGLYIATQPTVELGQKMGLSPGLVILNIDGRVMQSASAADDWLSRRPQSALNFTYAARVGGQLRVLNSRSQFVRPEAKTGTREVADNSKQYSTEELEDYCINLINQSRRSEGLSPVVRDSQLSRLARNYADYMSQNAEQYEITVSRSPHVDLQGRGPAERAQQAGISTTVLENIGRASRGFGSDQQVLSNLHDSMMSEPKGQMNHRSTIMDVQAHKIGVGVARRPGRFYLTEEFGY